METFLETLQTKIEDKTARLAIIGLGYVGLPVACMFAVRGFDVLGVELKSDRVDKINCGISPIDGHEPGLNELLAGVTGSRRLRGTCDYADLADRDVILIDVETPVDENHIPHYEALKSSLRSLGPVLKPGALVIVESTIAPGTMRDLVCPLLEESTGRRVNLDFYLGNCPERVMPGKLLANLSTLSRVVGGGTPETASVMTALYRYIVQADLDPVDWITAELVKTVENTYRDVQIAFANEVALICEALGGDVWKVRELVNKSPYRQMHMPGAGVGGHCIPKDPWLLGYGVKDKNKILRIIPTARVINDSMPLHMVDLLQDALAEAGQKFEGARVAVLGYSYLENSDDTRNSPSFILVQRLKELGVDVVIHDPWVEEYSGDLMERIHGCDAIVIMVAHSIYRNLDIDALKAVLRTLVLVDGRNVFDKQLVRAKGFFYRSIGLDAKSL